MTDNKSFFGTSGIRGDAEKLFTNQFCFDLGRTFAIYLNQKGCEGGVAIGTDPRGSSPRIKSAVEKGLWYEKREVFDQGATPVPSMCYVLQTNPFYAGSLMVTGSHIKSNLNGLKFFINKEEILKNDEKNIEDIYTSLKETVDFSSVPGPEIHPDSSAIEEYRQMLGQLAKPYPKWKIGVDCANGSQSVVIPDLLRDLGLEILEINCNLEEDFIARDTDTDDKAEIDDLKKLILENNCDFGIAFDGDGDRVVFLNERGEFVQGEYTCGLIAETSSTDSVVTTVSASQLVEQLGKKVYRTKVGSPYIIEKMKEVHSLFGFEANGGAVSKEVSYTRDGGVTAIKILNLFADFKGKFSEMIAKLSKFYMLRTKVDYAWSQEQAIIARVREKYSDKRIDETDGLKIWLNETTWILFRSSANAPEFRIFAESDDREVAEKLLSDGKGLVEEVINATLSTK